MKCAAIGAESVGAEAPPTKVFAATKPVVGGASAPMLSAQLSGAIKAIC
ncbi:DUF6053 domain-containing protein [Lysobacter gummosus]